MMFGEILIDGVFVAALLMAVACFAYLLYATIVERHLLRAKPAPIGAGATGRTARTVSSPAVIPPVTARDPWRPVPGSPAFPEGRG
jgi:hypothetical protein